MFYAMKVPMVTTGSGLQYKDIKVGQGPSPPIGFQVCQISVFCLPVLTFQKGSQCQIWTRLSIHDYL